MAFFIGAPLWVSNAPRVVDPESGVWSIEVSWERLSEGSFFLTVPTLFMVGVLITLYLASRDPRTFWVDVNGNALVVLGSIVSCVFLCGSAMMRLNMVAPAEEMEQSGFLIWILILMFAGAGYALGHMVWDSSRPKAKL